jgi:hypothetical protein
MHKTTQSDLQERLARADDARAEAERVAAAAAFAFDEDPSDETHRARDIASRKAEIARAAFVKLKTEVDSITRAEKRAELERLIAEQEAAASVNVEIRDQIVAARLAICEAIIALRKQAEDGVAKAFAIRDLSRELGLSTESHEGRVTSARACMTRTIEAASTLAHNRALALICSDPGEKTTPASAALLREFEIVAGVRR